MKYIIKGKNFEITDGIRAAIESSMERLDKYFVSEEIEAHVVVRTYKVGKKIEVTIFDDSLRTIRQEVMHDDLYAAIDLVGKKLEQQLRKIKDRAVKHNSKSDNAMKHFAFEKISSHDEEVLKISKRKTLENKPMTEEEALLQFELLGHDFFVFDDFKDNLTKILYKRHEGDYGIIEIEN